MDWFATLPHYADHMRPIRAALPAEHRGRTYGMTRARWPDRVEGLPVDADAPVVVAGASDAMKLRRHRGGVVLCDHGAGQSYRGDPAAAASPSYAGGDGLDHVRLFLCPNEAVAQRWLDRYPDAEAEVVGCPRLDVHHGAVRTPVDGRPVRVAFTFHWECRLCPETRSAWRHWRQAVTSLIGSAPAGLEFRGHSHPRAMPVAQSLQMAGADPIGEVDDVLRWADVLVADNTSVLYEAAAVGVSTVVLNAPWYRRDVHHGLRFWDAVPGPQIDDGDVATLRAAVEAAGADPGWGMAERSIGARAAYGGLVDGRASERAASALLALV